MSVLSLITQHLFRNLFAISIRTNIFGIEYATIILIFSITSFSMNKWIQKDVQDNCRYLNRHEMRVFM